MFPIINNNIFSKLSNRLDRSTLYLTGGVMVSSMLFYYFYSVIPTMSMINMGMFATVSKNWAGIGNNNHNDNAADDKPNKTDIVPYENKYYDKFEELEGDDLEEDDVKSLKQNVLYEMTPKGRIIMYYDFEKESFIYYCDTKDVSYLYLETVARKYALTYHCKKIVVDIKKELALARKTNESKNDGNKKVLVGVKADELFATFKSYNRKGSGGSKTMNKKFVLRQNANRYSYSGKVNEFPFIKTNEYKVEKPMDKMDYETFKKLMAKKN